MPRQRLPPPIRTLNAESLPGPRVSTESCQIALKLWPREQWLLDFATGPCAVVLRAGRVPESVVNFLFQTLIQSLLFHR